MDMESLKQWIDDRIRGYTEERGEYEDDPDCYNMGWVDGAAFVLKELRGRMDREE